MSGKTVPMMAALALAGCNTATATPPGAAPGDGLATFASSCKDFDDWDKPTPPFRIHGDTWYVGTCGIAAILIKGKDGAVLIDSGTDKGAQSVAANIESLGVRLSDVKAILGTHEHFDHAGGFARLQGLSGAPVRVGADAVAVIRSGTIDPRDPQSGQLEAMAPVTGTVRGVADGEVMKAAGVEVTAIATTGHNMGATSWQWKSCEGARCLTIVYADSLSAVSTPAYRFSDHPDYVAMFREGLARLRPLDCDLLLTPHPSASDMIARAKSGTMQGGMTCAQYADAKTKALDERLAKEAAAK